MGFNFSEGFKKIQDLLSWWSFPPIQYSEITGILNWQDNSNNSWGYQEFRWR